MHSVCKCFYPAFVRLAWPLTGRNEEMRTIEAALQAADLSGIVVCGAAGVGKSRIVREALAVAASNGCEVRSAVATSSAKSLPLGAFAAWADSAITDSLQVVRSVIDVLTAASPDTTAVVGVDDVHLLDDLSTFVLHQIVQRGVAKVAVTVRDGEPIPAAVQEIWKAGHFVRLDLQPLSMDETAALLTATLDGPVDPEAARRLWKLTHGNTLYLRNIVEQEMGDGRLAKRQGYWRWTGDPVLPPGLAELIASRMGELPAEVSEVVDVLAVGEPLELASLSRITDSAAVELANIRGLITLDEVDGRVEVRVAHPLYGEVRRNRVAPTRLRRLRGLVAAELAASEDRDDMRVVVRRAALSLDSDAEPDADLLVRAAHAATWQLDLPLASRLADAAIRAGGGPEASFIRAFLLAWLGHGQQAEAGLADASNADLTDFDRARFTFLRSAIRLFNLADTAGAKQLIDEALHVTPPPARDCIDAAMTLYWATTGMPDEARKSSERISWDQLPDVAARMTGWAVTCAAADAGRVGDAANYAEASYPIPMRGFLIITDVHASALLLAGRIADAQDVADLLARRAADYPSPQLSPAEAGLSGRTALGAGRLDAALSLLTSAVEAWGAGGDTVGNMYRYRLPLTIAFAICGTADEASGALAALEACRHPAWQFLDYERAMAHAWVAATQGAVSEATRTVLSAAETARANGQFAAEVMCLQTAAQFGDGSGAPRLRELEAIVEGPRAGIAARFAEAVADGSTAELQAVSDDFERMGDLIAAVDATAQAALAYRSADRKGSALTCSARAEELALRCGGASTPALRKVSEPLPFTDREREIVMLIGQGLSSPAIAKRLTLSVRTVEGHIYRAMTKTGATDRDQLAAMLPKG